MDRDVSYDLELDTGQDIGLDAGDDPGVDVDIDGSLNVFGNSTDYAFLTNKPSIEGVTLEGDKSFQDLGLDTITEADIDDIIFGGDAP